MFKPLLRTLPTLSGNFTLACPLQYILSDNNNYNVNIRNAKLIPLSNIISNPVDTNINLLENKYEYDVSKYYNHLADTSTFYKFYPNVDNNINDNIKGFDTTRPIFSLIDNNDYTFNLSNTRNTDYEFGVKRISYAQYGYQFMFYAPFYIDSFESLPEKFVIEIKYNNSYKGKTTTIFNKKININLGKQSNINYLRKYLKTYIDKIDNKVVNINSYYTRGMYYGIDVKHGGLQIYKYDNLIKLFSNYTDIMNFDSIINNGFEYTKQVMRQIIPLSFLFNIDDFLTENEKKYFYGKKFNIIGYFESKLHKYGFYDFDFDYRDLHINELLFNAQNGEIYNKLSSINVMDNIYGYKEKYLDILLNTNKVTPQFSHWKMLYSPDAHPYFINSNYSFSYNKNRNYGQFPNVNGIKDIYGLIEYNSNEQINSLILPSDTNSIDKYKFNNQSFMVDRFKTYIEHYLTNWYNISSTESIKSHNFNLPNKWADIDNGFAYFNGVLYNIKNLISLYKNQTNDSRHLLDNTFKHFGVFINFNSNYITKNELNKIKTSRYYVIANENYADNYNVSINTELINDPNISLFETYEINDEINKSNTPIFSSIKYNGCIYNEGTFIPYENLTNENSTRQFVNMIEFAEHNKYTSLEYLLSNVEIINKINDEIKNNDEEHILFDGILNNFKIDGFERINMSSDNVINYVHELFNLITQNTSNVEIIGYVKKLINNNLYVSRKNNSEKLQLNNDLINEIINSNPIDESYTLYIKRLFISLDNINSAYKLVDINNDKINKYFKEFNALLNNYVYEYIPKYENDNFIITNYFQRIGQYDDEKSYSNYLYIDSYNITNFIAEYKSYTGDTKDIKISDISPEYKYAYIKMKNMQMLKEYIYKLYKGKSDTNIKEYDGSTKDYDYAFYLVYKQMGIHNDDYRISEYYIEKFVKKEDLINYINDGTLSFDINTFKIKYNNAKNDADEFNGKYINIYIKKKVLLLTSELYKLFNESENTQSFKQLYLLKQESSVDLDEYYVDVNLNGVLSNDGSAINLYNRYEYIFDDNLFESIQMSKNIYNLFTSNLIDDSTTINLQKYTYHKVHIYKLKQYMSELFIDTALFNNSTDISNFKKYILNDTNSITSSINIDESKKYIWITLNITVDNSTVSFNGNNSYFYEVFNYINKTKITEENIDNVFTSNHTFLIPLLKRNLFKQFMNLYSNCVCIPIKLKYKKNFKIYKKNQLSVNNDLCKYIYTQDNNNTQIISINRYFGDCTPYLKETTIIPNFYSKPLVNSLIQYPNDIVTDPYYLENLDIYNAPNLNIIVREDYGKYIDLNNPNNTSKEKYFEYKYFNDNLMYNLESKIIIQFPIYVNKDDEYLYRKNKKTINSSLNKYNIGDIDDQYFDYSNSNVSLSNEFMLFKHYMITKYLDNDENNYINRKRYNIHFLFLFNKYNVSITSTPIYSNLIYNEDMYQMTYTYTLK